MLLVAISDVAISLLLLMLLLLLLLLLSSLLLLLLHLSLGAVVQSGFIRGYSFILAVVVVFPLVMLPLLLQWPVVEPVVVFVVGITTRLNNAYTVIRRRRRCFGHNLR